MLHKNFFLFWTCRIFSYQDSADCPPSYRPYILIEQKRQNGIILLLEHCLRQFRLFRFLEFRIYFKYRLNKIVRDALVAQWLVTDRMTPHQDAPDEYELDQQSSKQLFRLGRGLLI